jgi:hypothetical protein
MIIELEGKGIVCEVYYLTEDKFLALTAAAESKGFGLSSLIKDYCDCHIPVSQGFFSDNPETTCNLIKDNGEINSVAMKDYWKWDEILNKKEKSDLPEEDFLNNDIDWDFFVAPTYEAHLEPTDSQICLVAYSEFEYGKSTTSLPCEAADGFKGLRFITKCVDCEGFVREATYMENIVGTEEYNSAEMAIIGIEFNGEKFEIAEPIFKSARNRVWLYKFDKNEQSHQIDFIGSKKIRWLSASLSKKS